MFKPYRWSNTVCILLLLSHFIQSSVLETFILLHNLCFHFCCRLVFVVWICAVSFICSYSCFHVFFFFAMGNSVALSIPGIYFKMRICKNFLIICSFSLNCWIIVYVHVQLFNLMPNCSQQQFVLNSSQPSSHSNQPVSHLPGLPRKAFRRWRCRRSMESSGGPAFPSSSVCDGPGVAADAEDTMVNGREDTTLPLLRLSINTCSTFV